MLLEQGLDDPTPDDMARFVTWIPDSLNIFLASRGLSVDCNPSTPPANARLHLIDSRPVMLATGTTAACGVPMTPTCGSL